MSNLKSKLDNVKSARIEKSPRPQQDNPNDPIPYALTVVENRAALEALQKAAVRRFDPEDPLIQALADQVAEEVWTRQRLGVIHHQSLSFDIETNFDNLTAKYPNADASMHTIAAWKSNQADTALRRAFTDQGPLTSRYLRVMNYLHRTPRQRS